MLTERANHILDLEEQHPRMSGRKEDRIRTLFGVSAARYYQELLTILDDPAALQARPMLVKRLLNARDRLAKKRADRRF